MSHQMHRFSKVGITIGSVASIDSKTKPSSDQEAVTFKKQSSGSPKGIHTSHSVSHTADIFNVISSGKPLLPSSRPR